MNLERGRVSSDASGAGRGGGRGQTLRLGQRGDAVRRVLVCGGGLMRPLAAMNRRAQHGDAQPVQAAQAIHGV